jgi:ABC-2 type transport system ATP-binding protein
VVAEGTPDELKRRISGAHARLQFRDTAEVDAAARRLGVSPRDDEELVLRIPTDDTPRSLRALLERIDADDIRVEHVTVHPPDLDDVFLALTGTNTDHQKDPR